MAISINGNGTITGISVGGLPDGCVDNGTLANNAVNSNQIINGAVGSAELADDSVGAAQIADFFSASNGITLGGLRIQTGSFNLPSSVSDAGSDSAYPGARYYTSITHSVTGFSATPSLNCSIASGYHEAFAGGVHESQHNSSQFRQYFASHRAAGIQSEEVYWVAVGEAS
tara:strand:+ start:2958 stop:3470 length:513 start_codon:yes stop_codon:yes gene_type:complete